ncbi:MAG TPA: carboxymuconolactone decarboxylase family protein [Dehalococcoidia bacterium]|nr:carboxymuconolactone decarboxylase family protein [Dehalococcoidia bacterium]
MGAVMDEAAEAIGRIMGLTPDEARATLVSMYGTDIADEVLAIGRVWNRPGLTRRERSLVVIAALSALGTLARLRIHVGGALHHGATREEIEEVIFTMMAYAGHARATEAIEVARAVFEGSGDPRDSL